MQPVDAASNRVGVVAKEEPLAPYLKEAGNSPVANGSIRVADKARFESNAHFVTGGVAQTGYTKDD